MRRPLVARTFGVNFFSFLEKGPRSSVHRSAALPLDVRSGFHLPEFSERDWAALTFVGESYEAAQYQLHEAIFPGRTPTVVSRFVRRAVRLGLVDAERLHGFGMNRLRLTRTGLERLQQSDPNVGLRVFAPRHPVALKDLAHTAFINDLCVALRNLRRAPDELMPAWRLQRELAPYAEAIPDVLAIWRNGGGKHGLVLACEIDLGGEPLQNVFIPKLQRLLGAIQTESPAATVVFTRGKRRLDLLRKMATHASLASFELPRGPGREAVITFRKVFES